MRLDEILLKPIITEKSLNNINRRQYIFEVGRRANKKQVSMAVEKLFNVKVSKVTVFNRFPKNKRAGKLRLEKLGRQIKRAFVTIGQGQKIEMFDLVEKEGNPSKGGSSKSNS